MAAQSEGPHQSIELWDLPVRVIHWTLVALILVLWWTWRSGRTPLHEKLGYITLGLLLFRVLWGFFGSSTARFADFVKGPRQIALYLRGGSPVSVGHNPLGAVSVVALLGLMITEVGFGLFAQDVDGKESGALARFVSYDTADWARGSHATLFNVILAVIAIHVLAILFYVLIKRDNLIGPMIGGHKRFEPDVEQPKMAPVWKGVAAAAASSAITWWVSTGLKM